MFLLYLLRHRGFWLLVSLLLAGRLSSAQIVLPVEVLGAQGTTQQLTLPVANPGQVAWLYLRVHRPGFRAASTNPAARASLRLNNGTWVDITNANCEVYAQEAAYGGIGGGFQTVRFKVAVSKFGANFVAGSNTLAIRLNQTDGHSSGLRVLELNLLDAAGTRLLPAAAFVRDDPNTWTAPRPGAADVAEGQRLWRTAVLRESPLTTSPLRATCASCHHARGLDLKYFNYSNTAITERAKFHGLSQAEGEQLASYIRSLTLKKQDSTAYAAPGTPWNPPYQPGPGLDARPVEAWSAGAGLNAVLEKDSDMIPALFPGGTSVAAMRQVTSSKSTLNMREVPIALQLLDWNEWLSPLHPIDIWGDEFYTTRAWRSYQQVRQELAPNGRASVSKERVRDLMEWFIGDAIYLTLVEDGYRNKLPAGVTSEQATVGMRRWAATKIWELNKDFNLEDFAPQIYPAGERGWLGRARSVFELAPHLSAQNGEQFSYQSHLVGKYFSTAWYHTQVVVNPGYRDNVVHIPVDWKYHLDHIDNLSGWFAETPGEGLRYAASLIKDMQMWDNQFGVKDPPRGWNLREIKLENLVDPYYDKLFADVSPEFRRNLAEAFFSAWYEQSASYPIADYKRWNIRPDGSPDTGPGAYDWAPANFPFYPLPDQLKGYEEYPLRLREAIVYGRALGVNGDLLNRMADFGKAMWPLWDFDRIKGGTLVPGTGTGLTGEYFNSLVLDQQGAQPALTRLDPLINFTWPAAPAWPGARDNNFTVRWTGFVQPLFSGEQTFYVAGDDHAQLWVDGQLLCDTWVVGGSEGKIVLEAGRQYAIRMEYLQQDGGLYANLFWKLPNVASNVVIATSQLYPAPTPQPLTGAFTGLYTLEARHSGKLLDVSGASLQDGAAVVQWPATGGLNQQWQLTATGNGTYKLTAQHSGKVLGVSASSASNGAAVQQSAGDGSSGQHWRIEPTSDGYYQLIAECSGKCLDVAGGGGATGSGVPVQQWAYGGGANQQWKLTPVAGTRTALATRTAAAGAAGLSAYPNPSPDGHPALRLTAAKAQTAAVVVYDALGRTRARLELPVAAGLTEAALPQRLPAGLYYLQTTLDGQAVRCTLHVE